FAAPANAQSGATYTSQHATFTSHGARVIKPWGARGFIVEKNGGLFYLEKRTNRLTRLNPRYDIGRQIQELDGSRLRIRGN
ncbi:MAG: hypothetical protein AAF638_10140, partial [Pseudomonadota bacterium]